MASSPNEQYQIDIHVEYVNDGPRSLRESPQVPGRWQDLGHLSPGWLYSSGGSDSGSDCQSPASSPYSSPLLGPYDGLSSGSVTGLDHIARLSLDTSFYTMQDPEALLSSASLRSDSDASSLLSAVDPFFNYPSSPSSQTSFFSQCPSPVMVSQAPLTSFSPHDSIPPSYPLSASPTISPPGNLFLTSGPFDHGYSSSSPSSFNIPSPLPKSEPSLPIGMSEVTDFITEASDGQTPLDPAHIRAKLLHTLSPTSSDLNADGLKTLFSKNAKSYVSTTAGRVASELRRKHPARFACQFTGCNATFTRKLGLENHHKSHLGITDQQCRFCSKRFPNSLPRHMKRCKDNPARITTKKSKE